MRTEDDIAKRMVQRASVQDLLEQVARSIMDAAHLEVHAFNEAGNFIDAEDDLNVRLSVELHDCSDVVLRCISLKRLLNQFFEDDHELEFIPNMKRMRAIADHASALAAKMEAVAKEEGLIDEHGEPRYDEEGNL